MTLPVRLLRGRSPNPPSQLAPNYDTVKPSAPSVRFGTSARVAFPQVPQEADERDPLDPLVDLTRKRSAGAAAWTKPREAPNPPIGALADDPTAPAGRDEVYTAVEKTTKQVGSERLGSVQGKN